MIKRLLASLPSFKQRFEQWGDRERGFLLLVVFLALLVLWLLFMVLPLRVYRLNIEAKQRVVQEQIKALRDEAGLIVSKANSSDNAKNRQKHEALSEDMKRLDKTLEIYKNELIPAQDMPLVLRQVIEHSSGLQLVSLSTLTPEPLGTNEKPLLYQGHRVHRVAINMTFTGGYDQTADFLKRLEGLKWRFFWDSLSYSVVKYPEATISLRVSTLSASKEVTNG